MVILRTVSVHWWKCQSVFIFWPCLHVIPKSQDTHKKTHGKNDQGCIYLIKTTEINVKNYYNFKDLVSFWIYFKNYFIYVIKAEFPASLLQSSVSHDLQKSASLLQSSVSHDLQKSASLLQSSVSHDPSEITLIYWFAAHETFLAMLKTVVLLNILVKTLLTNIIKVSSLLNKRLIYTQNCPNFWTQLLFAENSSLKSIRSIFKILCKSVFTCCTLLTSINSAMCFYFNAREKVLGHE